MSSLAQVELAHSVYPERLDRKESALDAWARRWLGGLWHGLRPLRSHLTALAHAASALAQEVGGLDDEAIRRDMLSTRQFPGYVVQFDRQALIKADIKSLLDALAVGRQNGWYSANDILKKLGENPIDGEAGAAYLVNGNMIPVAQAGRPTAGAVSGGAR